MPKESGYCDRDESDAASVGWTINPNTLELNESRLETAVTEAVDSRSAEAKDAARAAVNCWLADRKTAEQRISGKILFMAGPKEAAVRDVYTLGPSPDLPDIINYAEKGDLVVAKLLDGTVVARSVITADGSLAAWCLDAPQG